MNSLDMEVPADVGTIPRRNSTPTLAHAVQTPYWRLFVVVVVVVLRS